MHRDRGDARDGANGGPSEYGRSYWSVAATVLMMMAESEKLTTATGASSSSKCPQVDEYVDTLNRSTTAAKIVGVACLDNSTYSFVLRGQDWRIMDWKQAEGRDELARRMALGR